MSDDKSKRRAKADKQLADALKKWHETEQTALSVELTQKSLQVAEQALYTATFYTSLVQNQVPDDEAAQFTITWMELNWQ